MRVDQTVLDDSVVEDGETTTNLISDGKKLTKNRDMNGTHRPNGVHLPNGCKPPCQLKSAVISPCPKQREPVEDCEEEEEEKEGGGEDVVDILTHSMKGVSIQETASTDLVKKLSELTVSDKDADSRCASLQSQSVDPPSLQSQSVDPPSLQSQSSTITVDPPSLPHEEEEERSEGAEDLAPRGPTAGKPASFRPNQDSFNHIAGKAYSSHNLDRFHPHFSPLRPPRPAAPPTCPSTWTKTPSTATAWGGSGGWMMRRRRRSSSPGPWRARAMRILRPGPRQTAPARPGRSGGSSRRSPSTSAVAEIVVSVVGRGFSVVSVVGRGFSVVVDRSLPPEELAQSLKPAGPISYQPQLSFTELDNMLETITQMEQADSSSVRDADTGYSSENSPHSDTTGSPGSSPKSVFSPPMRPPSNMSQDSGIASPFSEDTAPSPPEDPSQKPAWVSAAQPALYHSPPGGTVYHSPGSSSVYSPGSMAGTMSPPSATLYQNPPSVALYQNPPSVTHYQNPPSVALYQNAVSASSAMSPPTMYHSPPSVASVMSPYSFAGSDDLSVTSAPSPVAPLESQNDYMFIRRKEELRDALDVIAEDVKSMNQRKKAAQKSIAAVTPPPPSSTLPASVTQHKSGRPEKLPIAPLPKAGRGGAAQASPVITGSVPVMVVPKTGGVPPTTTTAATPITSCPLVVMNSGQNSMIVVLNGNSQPAAAQTPKKKLQKILPRPGPAISDCGPKLLGGKAPGGMGGDMAGGMAKQEVGGRVVTSGVNGVRPTPAVQPSPAPLPAPSATATAAAAAAAASKKAAQGRNPPQSKMLNIARRLVASMTTPDLQFQDSEGDTYLHVSVCKADKNMVQALLERLTRENLTAMINTENLMRQTPLYLAVSDNSPEMVSLLIQYGADVNVFAEHIRADGSTKEVQYALHCAASHGQRYLATLQALLAARDLLVDPLNSDGNTALHCAILEHGKADSEGGVINNLPIIQVLIKHGANPNAQSKKSGKTALMYALESRDMDLLEHMVAVIDPGRLRLYLKAQAFDGSTCQRFVENLQRSLDNAARQRLHACLRINAKRDNSAS
ncbi:hypothetical protein ACOMHN_045974 [Nucella lapillus]